MSALRWMPFGVSALGHLGVIALLWGWVQLPPRPPQVSMEAALIFDEPGGGLPALEPQKKKAPSPQPEPKPEPPAPPKPKPEPKPTIRSAQPKKEKPAPRPKPAPEPPTEKAAPQPAQPKEPDTKASGESTGAKGSGGTGGLLSAQLSAMSYKLALRRKVEERWTAPRIERDYQILFRMTILPDGRIGDLELRESSGLDLLDQGAKKAILGASPFAPPPPELLGQERHFEAWFRFRPDEAP